MRPVASSDSRFVHIGGNRLTSATASTVFASTIFSDGVDSVVSQPPRSKFRPTDQPFHKQASLRLHSPDDSEPSRCSNVMLQIWNFLERPDGGLANKVFQIVINLLIVISVLSPIIASTDISDESRLVLNTVDTCFTVLFSFELLLKIVICPSKFVFLKSFYTCIDLLVVIACWINFAYPHSEDMFIELIATMAPILRLLKIARHSAGWRLLVLSIKNCLAPLLVPLYLMLLMVVFSGSLHFWIDRHFSTCNSDPCSELDAPAFHSIPHGMWYVIVTVATVGYGDIVPHSIPGKVLASLQIVMGVCYMAMPLAVIGNSFSSVWEDRHRILMRDKLSASSSGMKLPQIIRRIQNVFNSYDSDFSGSVEFDEFYPFVQSLKLNLSKRDIRDIFNAIDIDGSQQVTISEFIGYVFPELSEEKAEEHLRKTRRQSRFE
jgi:voltage-gated potassium channel